MDNSIQLQIPSNILDNYLAIGFDVDHTLVRYKLIQLTRLTYKALMQTLIDKKNYPKELINLSDEEIGIGFNYCVIDLNYGHILKLSQDNMVMKAYHAFTQLSDEQIIKCYGNNRVINYDIFLHGKNSQDYFSCLTYYENNFTIMFAKITQNLQENKLQYSISENQKIVDYRQIMQDICFSIEQNYVHYNENICHPINSIGNFFHQLSKDIDQYVYKSQQFKQMLKEIKKKNIFTFIITNSHYEFANLTMSCAYGNDWQDLFDLIIYKSGKFNFFLEKTKPAYRLDLQSPNLKGRILQESIKGFGKQFLEGHYSMVEDLFINQFNQHKKILYVGDNLYSDTYFCQNLPRWDTVGIIEEFFEFNKENLTQEEIKEIPQYQKYWGSFFGEYINDKYVYTYWYWMSINKLKYIIRVVDSEEFIKMLL